MCALENERTSGSIQADITSRYQTLFEHSPIAIWEEDFSAIKQFFDEKKAEGVRDFRDYFLKNPAKVGELAGQVRILEINEASVAAVGATSKAEVIRDLPKYFTPASMHVFREELVCLARGDLYFRSEIPLVNAAGKPVIFDLSLSVPPAYAESLSRVLVSFVDVTESRKSEETVRQLHAELEAFSSTVSNNLRAPLQNLETELAVLRPAVDERHSDSLARIERDVSRMHSLIEGLLQLSRHASASISLSPVDLSTLAREICARLTAETTVKVEVEIQPDLRTICDRRLAEVVLTNLLSNAIKFSAQVPKPKIFFGRHTLEGRTVFVVRDNGIGFDMADAERLFNPFVRLHATPEFPGLGIGLAIVKRIVHRHGGEIWAQGLPGHGAAFFFTCGPQR